MMRRIGTITLAAALLAGCGLRADQEPATVDVAAGAGPEAAALTAMGFETLETASPAPDQRWPRRPARVWLRRNLLHGEVTVQTEDGTRTVLVQRGQVTALTDTEITVESSDGFDQTWTFHSELRVVEARAAIDAGELQPGDPVGVAGSRQDSGPVARLIVIDHR
jgi:hypothetical protein